MKRIQRKRTKGWRMPENAVYVGRPTRWGNPYKVGETAYFDPNFPKPTRPRHAVRFFRRHAAAINEIKPHWLDDLQGKDLACWCPLDSPCHADVLLDMLDDE